MIRNIEVSKHYRSDLKRIAASMSKTAFSRFEASLREAIELLMTDNPLPARYSDHPLKGNWKGYRDCHILPDLVLIYKKTDEGDLKLLLLNRLGSHSQLKL